MLSFLSSEDSFSIATLLPYILVSSVIFVISYSTLFKRKSFDEKCPPTTAWNFPIVGDIRFWTKRYDFWEAAMAQTKSKDFSFHMGQHRLVGTTSDAGRKLYFESKDLGFAEGSEAVRRHLSIIES